MNRAFRITAVCLAGLHLADVLLVSGGGWLAAYAHSHPVVSSAPKGCCHQNVCCGAKHKHASVEQVESGQSESEPAKKPQPVQSPCDDCAACRHQSQSLVVMQWSPALSVAALLALKPSASEQTPYLAPLRAFHSRGPPAAV